MQRERQKGNRDFGNRHIALFLSLVLLILCLVPGCDTLAVGIGGDAGSDTAAVFDSFTRDLFIDLASQDELTLNYTLADPSAYGITEAKSVFGSYSLENQKAEEELEVKEAKLEELKAELLKPEYQSSYSKLTEIQNEIDAMEEEIMEDMENWEALSQELEALEA